MLRRIVFALTSAVVSLVLFAPAASAEFCANEQLRVESNSTGLPDCRGFELVSPADKAAGMVAFPTGIGGYSPGNASPGAWDAASSDGNSVMYYGLAAFADPDSGQPASYRATRGPSGWSSAMWSPRPMNPHPNFFEAITTVAGATPDLSVGFFQTNDALDPLDQDFTGIFSPSDDVYSTTGTQSSITWQSRPNTDAPDTTPLVSRYVGATADGRGVFFQSTEAFVPAAAGQVAGSGLYEHINGQTQLVGVQTDGSLTSQCGSVLGSYNFDTTAQVGGPADSAQAFGPVDHAISSDGSRVFFSSPDPNGPNLSSDPSCTAPVQVYARTNGQTVHVSRSQRTAPDTPQAAYFQGASADGSNVFFLSSEALTDTATPGTPNMLYGYNMSSGALTLLTPSGHVRGVTRVSADGTHVYYVGADGAELDVAAAGANTRIADLLNAGGLVGGRPVAQTTPDGRYLVFLSADNLTGQDPTGVNEAYRYDDATGQLTCIACSAVGNAPLTGTTFVSDLNTTGLISQPAPHIVTDDGSRIFFQTSDALVAQDDNNAPDVYEWHDGDLSLISDGRAAAGSYLFDTAMNGHDVFFATAASLVSQDRDNGDQDIYDARVGGGFPPDSAPLPLCVEDQCQGAPTPGADLPSAASSTLFTIENAAGGGSASKKAVTFTVKPISPAAQRTFAKSGKTSLSVTVSAAGTARVSVKAKIGRQTRTVAQASKAATKASTVSLGLSLSQAARLQLARSHKLKLTINVAFPGASSRIGTLTLTAPKTTR